MSAQFDGIPKSDFDFRPLGKYGESKVLAEQAAREANLDCTWTIVRPTNIWGPWNIVYTENLFRSLEKRRYLHPGKKAVMRSYGYVGNVVFQLMAILDAPKDVVNKEVFYVGIRPVDLYIFVNTFSMALTGNPISVAPRWLLRVTLGGDVLGTLGISAPLTSSRYKNMTVDNPAPMEKTFRVFGENPYNLEEGVGETVAWYKSYRNQS